MKLLKEILQSKLILLYASLFLLVVFSFLDNYYDWASIGMLISIIYPVFFLVKGMIYLIINAFKND